MRHPTSGAGALRLPSDLRQECKILYTRRDHIGSATRVCKGMWLGRKMVAVKYCPSVQLVEADEDLWNVRTLSSFFSAERLTASFR